MLELLDHDLQYVLTHDYYAIIWGLGFLNIAGGRAARTEEVPLARSILELDNPDPERIVNWGHPSVAPGGFTTWFSQLEWWVGSAGRLWRPWDREEWLAQAWVMDEAWMARQAQDASTTLGEAMDVDSLQRGMEAAGWEYTLPPVFK